MRLKIIRLILILLLGSIGLDLIMIQVVKGRTYYNLSVNNRIRIVPLEETRGRILDRNGVVLAGNRLSFSVSVIPQDMQNSEALFAYLSEVLNMPEKRLKQVFFQRKVTPFAPVVIAEDIDKEKAMMLEENKFRFPGLYIQQETRRFYPFGDRGAHVLGYVGKINRARMEKLKDYGYRPTSRVGYSGVEEYYDSYLRGREGGLQVEVNSRGQQVRLLSLREPEKGHDIRLTIDQRIQDVAAELLQDKQGVILIMDYESGEVLSMASSPAFDPNLFSQIKCRSKAARLFLDEFSPMLNRAIQGVYPPGSVFKLIGAVAALDTQTLQTTTTFLCPGSFKLGRRRFRCAHTHGPQDMFQAIVHSCNVYFYHVGLDVGPETLARYGRLMGLGRLTSIDLPFEEKGQVPSPSWRRKKNQQPWYKGDTLNLAIGQGDILVTPIQLTRMMAVIARSGEKVQPYLIQAIDDREVVHAERGKRVRVEADVFSFLQESLRQVVADSSGTAHALFMADFPVYGKTGTAQSVRGRDHHSWFVGFAPAGRHRIAFCVFLEHGGSSVYAVRLARRLISELRARELL